MKSQRNYLLLKRLHKDKIVHDKLDEPHSEKDKHSKLLVG
ncbi:unnamed protein product [Schistosoma margrebowiei]|uniref:Uncharacterized protein n=1 Tax=Schistosoma margrebowiei TaxID=48269 RepID=A0A183N9F1_9TREM|nr:unnamed protein product [Schistosoma margrebowiei]